MIVALCIATMVSLNSTHEAHANTSVVASWYGPGFHGKQTASGAWFDMHELTVAVPVIQLANGKKKPAIGFCTVLLLTNPDTKRQVTAVVNDTGAFGSIFDRRHKRNRGLDVSHAVAKKLGFVQEGTADLQVTKLGTIDKKSPICSG